MNEPALHNADADVVAGFGDEWARFDQQAVPDAEITRRFDEYFSVFPWASLPSGAEGFDAGCGSGRWARHVAPRVGKLNAIDASSQALASLKNVNFITASVADMPLADASQDFGYSLGVLHHMPDTQGGLDACVRKLKPGAPFLVYLYYRFDNRSAWFRALWQASDAVRRRVSVLPHGQRYAVSQIIAALVYWPLARLASLVERLGLSPAAIPLSFYRDKAFYTMRTDALDRFGTRLEQRFTRAEMTAMMQKAGPANIRFREAEPFWCAVGVRAS